MTYDDQTRPINTEELRAHQQQTAAAPAPEPAPTSITPVLVAAAVTIVISVGIGVYGRLHEATFFAFNIAGFSSGAAAKSWLGTLAFLLAVVQLVTARMMYRSEPARMPSWAPTVHRWSGRVAVIVTVPVAVHCLYALGFQPGEPRTLIHSLFGCFFYGAFAAKMLLLTRKNAPGWALPVYGGAVFAGLTALWLTSSVWFFTTSGLTF